ncbi:OmpA family protein [Sulfurovum sp. zt1-1]|uniref:OmpA family protein n=1 Tax=Sulfurovum zhangzhouensis TaxID=3019067 RepID=A0ABT7QUX0_9BACT|nr:OmpA family protein [Sulfurovum zhangzhouensis]MDM5270635.1 OmpA family protein [Sulfurovum zhangzhouensis]
MFRKKATDEGSNFWISYADLMAGLLFVFILLIGAIVSKSMILKSNLHDKEEKLSQVSKNLEDKEGKLEDIKVVLAKYESILDEKEALLSHNKKILDKQQNQIITQEQKLQLSAEEIKKLNQMLLEANTLRDSLNDKVIIVQNLLAQKEDDIQKQSKRLEEYEGKVLILSNQLTQADKNATQKDEKILALLNALDEKETNYDALVAKLQEQKARIKSLTGLKIKVIAALKEELGDKVNIDKNSGSLKLASNILFDRGSYTLKKEAEAELKKAFEEYVGTLVTSPKIKPYLDKVIIEGHTDSDGGYLYNLDLSQKRAFAVMNFLLTLDFAEKYNVKPLMIASGRAYLDPIVIDGKEDKEASRRIEIKFRLKNQDAMEEIEKVLDAQ